MTVGPGAPGVRPAKKGSAVTSASSAAHNRRSYVIDTSVLLSDPHALRRFAEHDVVLPVVVITELEAKRHHSRARLFRPHGPASCSTTCGSPTAGWTPRSR